MSEKNVIEIKKMLYLWGIELGILVLLSVTMHWDYIFSSVFETTIMFGLDLVPVGLLCVLIYQFIKKLISI